MLSPTALQLRVKAYFFGLWGERAPEAEPKAVSISASSTLVLIVASLVNGELG